MEKKQPGFRVGVESDYKGQARGSFFLLFDLCLGCGDGG